MSALVQLYADDPFGLYRLRLGLHPRHREFTRVVDCLRVVRHLNVAAYASDPSCDVLMRDVVDTVSQHKTDWPITRREQRPEVLPREIACERTAVRRAVQFAACVLHRRSDRDELSELAAPFVTADLKPDAHDSVRTER